MGKNPQSIKQIEEMTTEELRAASPTIMSQTRPEYYLAEIGRRESRKQMEAVHELTQQMVDGTDEVVKATKVILALTVVNLLFVIYSVLK